VQTRPKKKYEEPPPQSKKDPYTTALRLNATKNKIYIFRQRGAQLGGNFRPAEKKRGETGDHKTSKGVNKKAQQRIKAAAKSHNAILAKT